MFYTLAMHDSFHYVFKDTDDPEHIYQLYHSSGYSKGKTIRTKAFWTKRPRDGSFIASGKLTEHATLVDTLAHLSQYDDEFFKWLIQVLLEIEV